MLAKRDQQAINFYPIGTRQNSFERDSRFFRRRRVDIAPAIRDTMHMDVHTDSRLITRDAEHKIRTLRADTVEREENSWIARENATMFLDDTACDLMDLRRFRLVKSAGANSFING